MVKFTEVCNYFIQQLVNFTETFPELEMHKLTTIGKDWSAIFVTVFTFTFLYTSISLHCFFIFEHCENCESRESRDSCERRESHESRESCDESCDESRDESCDKSCDESHESRESHESCDESRESRKNRESRYIYLT